MSRKATIGRVELAFLGGVLWVGLAMVASTDVVRDVADPSAGTRSSPRAGVPWVEGEASTRLAGVPWIEGSRPFVTAS